eukprot:1159991-Pelagomonas_calceolata.AAC.1
MLPAWRMAEPTDVSGKGTRPCVRPPVKLVARPAGASANMGAQGKHKHGIGNGIQSYTSVTNSQHQRHAEIT